MDTDKRIYPPIHPGELLREEFLEPMGISPYKLAKDIDVDQMRIHNIVHGERSVTPDTALRLSRYFGMSDSYWINAQAHYDLEKTKMENGERIRREVTPAVLPAPAGRPDEETPDESVHAVQEPGSARQAQVRKMIEQASPVLNEDIDFVVSAQLLKRSATLLADISREIKAHSSDPDYSLVDLQRLTDAYGELKELVDEAFALHDRKFGLPEEAEDEAIEGVEEPQDREIRKLERLYRAATE